ncbi:MAG TPA: Zn-binding domain-containing protein, partial [Ktedonobacteraceae bacterium]|nr:Zn-binding domain-containing protein [Ktedonobacteraceae bacterium]
DIPQGYRLALLRQVADRFYSMQRMCAAVVEPTASSLRLLKKKPMFARLQEDDLRAFLICWIEALFDESAFDASIASSDRRETVPGDGFKLDSTSAKSEGWNDAEKAAEALLGYARSELQQLRTMLVDEFCEVKEGIAYLKPEKLAIRLTLDDAWHQCEDCAQLIWLPLRETCPNPHCGSKRLIQLPGNDPALRARTDFYREPIRQVINSRREPMHLTAEEHTAQLSHRDRQQVFSTTEEYELRFQNIGLAQDRPAVDVLSCTTTMEVGVDIGSLLGIGLRTMPPRRANYQQRAGRAGRRSSTLSTVLAYSENGSHDAHYFEHPDEMISGALPSPKISQVNGRLARRHVQAALIQTFFREYLDSNKPNATRQYGYLNEALGTARAFFDPTESYGISRFEDWLDQMLSGASPQLLQQVVAWLPDTLENRPLTVSQKRDFVRDIASRFLIDLRKVGEELYPQPISRGIEDQQFDKRSDELMLLDLLFDHGFLPTYAFPRDVRDFVIEEWKKDLKGNWRIGMKQRPEQSVDVALSEYVPGRELIVDKETYRVGGIYVDPFPGATVANRVPTLFKREQHTFAFCSNCGYTQRLKTDGETTMRQCPLCHSLLAIQEILDPPGFAPRGAKHQEPGPHQHAASIPGGTITQVNLVLPLTDEDDFGHVMANGRVAWSYKEHRELLIANSGKSGDGFSVCRSCGAAGPGYPPWLEQPHDRPFLVPSWMSASRKCSAPDGIWRGYLGHVFHSDLLLLRLRWPDDVAYDVGHPWMQDAINTIAQGILLAATRLLDVASSELQVGWSYTVAARGTGSGQNTPPRMVDFFVFDTLSGGAGYATQVGQHIESLLSLTQEILSSCPEQCERSCYRCLRTYANRIKHAHLDRRLGGTLLQAILSGHAPDTLPVKQQAAQLDMLRQYLELAGMPCEGEGRMSGRQVPLLVKSSRGTLAVGTFPIQQGFPKAQHPLNVLPAGQVRLFSDFELAHDLPHVAQRLLG